MPVSFTLFGSFTVLLLLGVGAINGIQWLVKHIKH